MKLSNTTFDTVPSKNIKKNHHLFISYMLNMQYFDPGLFPPPLKTEEKSISEVYEGSHPLKAKTKLSIDHSIFSCVIFGSLVLGPLRPF